LPPQHIGEVQTTAVRIDLGTSFVLTFGWAQLSKTTVRSSLMSWSAWWVWMRVPRLNSWATRKPQKN